MIDCDVHQNLNSIKDLSPWLAPTFREYVEKGAYAGYQLPSYPWTHPGGFLMGDAFPPDGGVPGSNYEFMRDQLLDGWDVEFAILNGEDLLNVGCMPQPAFAAELASAYNRHLIEVWLPRDPRLKGSLLVAPQDPDRAAAEIRANGDHPDIVQVLIPSGAPRGYGDPFYRPLFEAAAEMGLPVAIHAGVDGIGINSSPTGAGYPTYYVEYHALLISSAQAHLASFICHGVFEELRDLKIVITECGVVWLPGVLWRLDANWKALRMEVPWVKRLPSETVQEHVRFTTQPLETPPNARSLKQVLEAIDGMEHMLMFATDYPHWDVDAPERIARRLPDGWADRVMSENARELYGLPAPRTATAQIAAGQR